MFTSLPVQSFVVLAQNTIQKEPGVIVRPITIFLGSILNAIFNFVYQFTSANSLGFSIILLTIIARFLMLPLAVQQQRSMLNMQRVQPEMEKIKKKYGNSKEPAVQQKMNAEIQKLYSDHKVNPLMGCLPLVIQMPIFVALAYIMNQPYVFIDKIGAIYYSAANSLAQNIIRVDGFMKFLKPLAEPKLPKDMVLYMLLPEDLAKVINRFSSADWNQLLSSVPSETENALHGLLAQKAQIESFAGIDLLNKSVELSGGFSYVLSHMWPGILIPIVAMLTSLLSTYIMNKQSKTTDENAKMQQKVMLVTMPLLMGFMTTGFPAGVGLYWVTSSVFQIFQQVVLHKIYFRNEESKTEPEPVKAADKKKG